MGLDFIAHDYTVGEVGGSNPGRGTIVEWVVHPTRQLVKLSAPDMPSIVNS